MESVHKKTSTPSQELKSDSKGGRMEKKKGSEKPFDQVFRTMVEKMPELLIPLINEVFGTDYSWDTEVVQLRNEHQKEHGSIITDAYVMVKSFLYHIECQSVNDSTMSLRMFEYDITNAIENAEKLQDGSYVVRIPASCVLYVRANEKTPREHRVVVEFPDKAKHTYSIPCIRCDEYTVDDIFVKKLLFFLPYYITRYQNRKKFPRNEVAINRCLEDMREISERLETVATEMQRKDLAINLTNLIVRISDYIFDDEPEVKEGVETIMLNGTYMLETERLFEEGRKTGEITGEKKNREVMLFKALQRGATKEQLIHLFDYSEEEIAECEKKLRCMQ